MKIKVYEAKKMLKWKEKPPYSYQIQQFIGIFGVHAVVISFSLLSQMLLQFTFEKPKADQDHQQNPPIVLDYVKNAEESVHQPTGVRVLSRA